MLVNTTDLLPVWEALVSFPVPSRKTSAAPDALLNPSGAVQSVTSLHALLDWDNLSEVLPKKENVSTWASGTYAKGAVVKVSTNYFESLVNSNTFATTDATKWLPTDPLSVALRESRRIAAGRLLQRIMQNGALQSVPTRLLRPLPIYEREGKPANAITKAGRFVGIRLQVRHPDTMLTLHRLSVQLTAVQDLTLYLYNDTDIAPVTTFTVPAGTYNNRPAELELTQTLFAGGGKPGVYYLGYYEADLIGSAQAINRGIDLTGHSRVGCSSCDAKNTALRSARLPYVQLQPFSVHDPTVEERWIPDAELYTNADNYGIGLELSVSCDLTRLLIDMKGDVADALAYQWAVVLLEAMAHSQAQNPNRERLVAEAQYALGMNKLNPDGIKKDAERAIDGLRLSLASLSPVCLPPSADKAGIRISSQFARR